MSVQLTPEQEQRIQAVVRKGVYSSVEEALDAAVIVMETTTDPDFEGSDDEIELLLMEGLASPELSEHQFWETVEREAKALLAAPRPTPLA